MSCLPTKQLVDILSRYQDPAEISPEKTYKQVTVRLFHKGVVLRGQQPGGAISSRQWRVCSGQVLLSRIDARNGAIGLVPPELDGAIVTNDFWAFDVDPKLAEPRFLDLYFGTLQFVEDCQRASEGTTNRVRVQPDRFLQIAVPLPPVPEQHRIVARIEELSAKIEEARRMRSQAIEETVAFISSISSQWFEVSALDVPLGDVCTVIDPNPSHRYPVYVPDGIPIVSSSEFVGEDGIDPTLAKRVPASFYEKTLGQYGVGEGDIVFSRKGKVGYARPHPKGVKVAMTHTLCVLRPNPDYLLPRYALLFARSARFINALTGTMNPNAGVPTLGLGVIRTTRIPLKPLPEQRRIVAYLDDLQAKVDTVGKLQEESEEELNAVIPSILSRAFAGEL